MPDSLKSAETVTVWFGTRGAGQGIYRSVLDLQTGRLTTPELAAEVQGAGFVITNAAGDRLFSLGNAVTDSPVEANVSSFAVDTADQLHWVSRADSGAGRPTHLALSPDESTLLLASYSGGKVASLPVDGAGRLLPTVSIIEHQGSSINPERQSEPHPHWIGTSPDGRFVFVPDLGTDEIVIYALDSTSHALQPHGKAQVPPGAGPRHMKFHPNGTWVYVLNEMGLTVSVFRYDARIGSLELIQTIEAIAQSEVKDILTSGAEIRLHPSGDFVYAAIRGHDVIAVFSVDANSGELTLVEREPIRGSWPRNFGIDPTGRWLLAAGAETSNVTVFAIDPDQGRLTYSRNVVSVPEPICVTFQPLPQAK